MLEMATAGGHLYRQSFAGDPFNTAWDIAQLLTGYAEVGFITCSGQDNLSERFTAEIASMSAELPVTRNAKCVRDRKVN
jgi:sugar/nucleoside kinase (ribokinase family)